MFSLFVCTKVFSKGLGIALTILNVYGPYEGKQVYWDILLALKCLKTENLIVGGDLNLTMNGGEVWGP